MSDVFWHRPEGDEKKKFHAYNMQGGSLCKKWVLFGMGMPADATKKMPKKGRCGECLRKINGR